MGNGKPFLWRLPIFSFVLKIGRAISACLKDFLSQVIWLSRSITTKLSVLGVFLPRFYNANFLMWCVRTHLVLLVWSVLAWGIKPLPLSLKKLSTLWVVLTQALALFAYLDIFYLNFSLNDLTPF